MECSAVNFSTLECSTVECSTVEWSTVLMDNVPSVNLDNFGQQGVCRNTPKYTGLNREKHTKIHRIKQGKHVKIHRIKQEETS